MTGFQEIQYESNDGLKLYARDYTKEGSKLTILCMHGLTRSSADFEDLAPLLQEEYRVITVDQRGRGESDWDTNPSNYTTPTYVGDMFSLIDALSLENIVMIGTSMGGFMAMMMNSMKPALFAGLVLNDIGPEVSLSGLERIRLNVGKSVRVDSWQQAIEQVRNNNAIAFPSYDEEQWSRFAHRLYKENSDGTLSPKYDPAIAEPMSRSASRSEDTGPWLLFNTLADKPLLLFRGELSDILNTNCVEQMQKSHPTMQYVEIPGVGHAPMLDEPGVVPALNNFLRSI